MSTQTAGLIAAGEKLIDVGAAVGEGRVADAVKAAHELLALLISELPVDQLKESLTNEARVFADLTVDVAEEIKLEGEEP